MNTISSQSRKAAQMLTENWIAGSKIAALPDDCRPLTVAAGAEIQRGLGESLADSLVGWKIAATSLAGQQHIQVDGPLAGRLFASRVLSDGAEIPLNGNKMLVAECEFVFVMGSDLPPRNEPYSQDEVLTAVASLHPGLELPDSRFEDFASAGAAQLIADNACAHYFVLGEACDASWRDQDLSTHVTRLFVNDEIACHGSGIDVLGDPRLALTWIANNHLLMGEGLKQGQVITTGVSGKPTPIKGGDQLCADLGAFGKVSASVMR